jgi:phosphopentomutase
MRYDALQKRSITMAKKSNAVSDIQKAVVSQLEEARTRFGRLEKELVAKGRAQQKELEGLIKRVKSGQELKKLEKRATAAGSEVLKRVDAVQTKVLNVIGAASQSQVSNLVRDVQRLAKKVDGLTKATGKRTESVSARVSN